MELATVSNNVIHERDLPHLQRLAARVEGLPALPLIASRLLEAVDDPSSSAADLSTIISSDQALAARLLKLANSTYYGFPRRIATVNLAIVVLGLETVRDLCLSVLITDCFFRQSGALPFDLEDIWKHSLTAAIGGRMIFRMSNAANPGEGFIAGLVHDIGKLFLGRYFPVEYREVMNKIAQEGLPPWEAEKKVFQATHAQAGAWLLDNWNLPTWLAEAVRDHHGPETEAAPGKMAQALTFTDFLVRRAHSTSSDLSAEPQITSEMAATLKLKRDVYGAPDFNLYLDKLRRELQRAADLMEMIRHAPAQPKNL